MGGEVGVMCNWRQELEPGISLICYMKETLFKLLKWSWIVFLLLNCSYPPPRERCAGPCCVNPYKYRDSKTKLPLCSLECFKAIHEKGQA